MMYGVLEERGGHPSAMVSTLRLTEIKRCIMEGGLLTTYRKFMEYGIGDNK
jgi:hypothetical protein